MHDYTIDPFHCRNFEHLVGNLESAFPPKLPREKKPFQAQTLADNSTQLKGGMRFPGIPEGRGCGDGDGSNTLAAFILFLKKLPALRKLVDLNATKHRKNSRLLQRTTTIVVGHTTAPHPTRERPDLNTCSRNFEMRWKPKPHRLLEIYLPR